MATSTRKIKSLSGEKFKEIKFPKGALRKRYAISTHGRVISFTDKIETGRLLKAGSLDGYPVLSLRPHGTSKTFFIHRLVADHFVSRRSNNHAHVLHLDFDKANNHLKNLKWATQDQMLDHQRKNPLVLAAREKRKLIPVAKGHKLTAKQVAQIKKKISSPKRKLPLREIAAQFNISEMQLYRIKSGENWSHVN